MGVLASLPLAGGQIALPVGLVSIVREVRWESVLGPSVARGGFFVVGKLHLHVWDGGLLRRSIHLFLWRSIRSG